MGEAIDKLPILVRLSLCKEQVTQLKKTIGAYVQNISECIPMKKSDINIAANGTMIEKVRSFLIKGRKIIPANIVVIIGGRGMTLLTTRR